MCNSNTYVWCGAVGLARLQMVHEVIASTNWTLVVEPLRLYDVTFSYMQLRSLDMRDTNDKYIVLDLSSADALTTVLKQVATCLSQPSAKMSVCHAYELFRHSGARRRCTAVSSRLF